MSEITEQPHKQPGLLHSLKKAAAGTRIIRSVFRHGYEDTERNRSLQIVSNLFFHLHPVRTKENGFRIRFTWCMGGITFLLFLIELVTGIMLMFYYRPVVEYAYMDTKSLMIDVPFGRVIRNVHRWGAHLMVLTVMLHMLRVFLTGSYKPPREFNWVIGVLLLTGTLLLSFTGYLLPWDQLGYWAICVGTNMARATPFLGHEGPFALVDKYHDVRFILLGASDVGPSALLRFYVLHVILLPMVVLVFCAVHFWRVRKDGGISGPL